MRRTSVLSLLLALSFVTTAESETLKRIAYNHPGLTVDLGVGLWAWPMPMDYDNDGDNDLVVVCPDYPYNGAYFFENPGGDAKMPVFKAGVKIDRAVRNPQVSNVDGKPRVLAPGVEFPDFRKQQFAKTKKLQLPAKFHSGRIRANQWKYVDYDGDQRLDLVVGVGDWSDYGWDNAFDSNGDWTNGPLHGYVYLIRNQGSEKYAQPLKLQAGGEDIDVFGMPSPSFADFDGDGDLDLICGEFLDGFSYFQNVGSRTEPKYEEPVRLTAKGKRLRMDLQMITPTAVDWDGDGDVDLVVGDEDGRVALIENLGPASDKREHRGPPAFAEPKYFQQEAEDVKFGALVTPVSFDWDGDGDEDLICGNTAGYIGFIENLDGGDPPKWAAPRRMKAEGDVIRIQAGRHGSIQGPCEAKWGYTTLSVADWDADGLADVVVNSIWGRVVWFKNVGAAKQPKLARAQSVQVDWAGKSPPKPAWNWWSPKATELATQWRTTPIATDFDNDGLCDLLMLDQQGYLALFRRVKRDDRLVLTPPQRIFRGVGASGFDSRQQVKRKGDGLLQLNVSEAGASGRRKLAFADWDGDGKRDLLVNSGNVNFLRNVAKTEQGGIVFQDMGQVHDHRLAGHTTSPTLVDWNKDGVTDLLIGAEDGYLYLLRK